MRKSMGANVVFARDVKAAFVAALLFCAGHASAGSYDARLLEGLGGSRSWAMAINNAGQIVGGGNLPSNTEQAALLWSGGVLVNLGQMVTLSSTATAINNAGQIAGAHSVASFWESAATVWSAGVATDLTSPASGVSWARASGINDFGAVTGTAQTRDNSLAIADRAVIWANGGLQYLPGLDMNSVGAHSYADALNNAGQVVGHINGGLTNWNDRAVLWDEGQMHILSTLGGAWSRAAAISSSGIIAGWSGTGTATHATLWAGKDPSDLGVIAGMTHSFAMGINDLGQVVGVSGSQYSADSRATLWSDGEIINLDQFLSTELHDAGWHLTNAMDVNDQGQIVGLAINSNTLEERAFLMSPLAAVPEPASVLMLGTGVFLLFLRRRQQS